MKLRSPMAPHTIHVNVQELAPTTTREDLEHYLNTVLPHGSESFVRPLNRNPETGSKFTTFLFRSKKKKAGTKILQNLLGGSRPLVDGAGCRYTPIFSWDCIGLSLVAWPREDASFDVCFVHGFGGHALKTFSSKSNSHRSSVFWPCEILPRLLEEKGLHGRYMTFGYDQGLWRRDLVHQTLEDEASKLLDQLIRLRGRSCRKPLLFICHSLGGLLALQTILLAHDQISDLNNRDAFFVNDNFMMRGIITFGTPFQGSILANIGARIAKTLILHKTLAINVPTLSYLSVENVDIKTLVEAFRDLRSQIDFPMLTVYEIVKVHFGPFHQEIVARASATKVFGDDVPTKGLRANHTDLVKFTHNDPNFADIAPDIVEFVQNALAQSDRAKAPARLLHCTGALRSLSPSNVGSNMRTAPAISFVTAGISESASSVTFSDCLSYPDRPDDLLRHLQRTYLEINQPHDVSIEGTCEWFWRKGCVQQWLRSKDASILFVEGRPGVGKSALSRFVFRTLPEQHALVPESALQAETNDSESYVSPIVVHFYKNRTPLRHTKDIFVNIAAQLAHYNPTAVKELIADLLENTDGAQKQNLKFWLSLLQRCPGKLSKDIFCIVDALDECVADLVENAGKTHLNTTNFLQQICQIVTPEIKHQTYQLHILFFTRSRREIDAVSNNWNMRMEIQNADTQSGFEIMVRQRVEELSRGSLFPIENQNFVVNEVIRKCAPNFQMAHQLIEQLRTCALDNEIALCQAIEEFRSNDLNDLYRGFLQKLRPQNHEATARLIKTLYFAEGNFTTGELRDALAIQTHDHTQDLSPCSIDFFFKGDCKTLVKVEPNEQIHLDHTSVRDFFRHSTGNAFKGFDCSDKSDGHSFLAMTCVRYLLYFGEKTPLSLTATDDEYISCMQQQPFLRYAAVKWTIHARECGTNILSTRCLEPLSQLLRPASKSYHHMLKLRHNAINSDAKVRPDYKPIDPESFVAQTDLYMLMIMVYLDDFSNTPWRKAKSKLRELFGRSNKTLTRKVNAVDYRGRTNLHYASESGSLLTVRVLLKLGATGSIGDEDGRTPFELAVSENHEDVATLLLQNSEAVIISSAEKERTSALHMAVHYKMEAVVRSLLRNGENPNSPAIGGWTPLHIAAGHDGGTINMNIVNLLLEANANISMTKKGGETPIHVAARKGNLNFIKRLLQHEPSLYLRPKTNTSLTPIHLAARSGHLEVFKYLLTNTPITNKDDYGYYPSHYAAMNGHVEILKLLRHSDTLVATNKTGRQPLHLAALHGKEACVMWLLENTSVNPDIPCMDLGGPRDQGRRETITPCFLAAVSGHHSLVKMFFDKNVKKDVRTASGETMLHVAAKGASVEMFLYLAEFFDMTQETDHGLSPFHYAAMDGNLAILRFYVEGSDSRVSDFDINKTTGDGSTGLLLAIRHHQTEAVEYLLEKGADVTISDEQQQTPLLTAIAHYSAEFAEKLLDKKADINKPNGTGWKPLQEAARLGLLESVKLLLRAGGDLNYIVPTLRASALILAAAQHQYHVVKWLLQVEGIDVNLRDVFGNNAFDYMRQVSYFDDILEEWKDREERQSAETQRTTLENLIRSILMNFDLSDRDQTFNLSRALLWSGDEESARVLTEHPLERRDPPNAHFNKICDVCFQQDLSGSYQICTICLNYDICEDCIGTKDERNYGCDPSHRLIELGGERWKSLAPGTVNEEGDTIDTWIAKLNRTWLGDVEAAQTEDSPGPATVDSSSLSAKNDHEGTADRKSKSVVVGPDGDSSDRKMRNLSSKIITSGSSVEDPTPAVSRPYRTAQTTSTISGFVQSVVSTPEDLSSDISERTDSSVGASESESSRSSSGPPEKLCTRCRADCP